MLERHRIRICTLYAPYASRRHEKHAWRTPVKRLKIREKLEPASGLEPLTC